jgi:hypothetical protein
VNWIHSIRDLLLYRSMTVMTASARIEVRAGENIVHSLKRKLHEARQHMHSVNALEATGCRWRSRTKEFQIT